MSYPPITIALTCYNAQNTVARAIESALAQDWPNKEIIVCDDCSTDGSLKILERYASEGAVTLLRHEVNRGVSAGRNAILREAKGAYVAIFDDDDVSDPSRLTKQHQRLAAYEAEHPGAPVLCLTAIRIVGGRKHDTIRRSIGDCAPEPYGRALFRYLARCGKTRPFAWGDAQTHSAVWMARRGVFLDLGGFDEALRRMEDREFLMRFSEAGGHAISVAEPLVEYAYKTPGAEKSHSAIRDSQLRILAKHSKLLRSRGYYAEAWADLHVRHYRISGRPWRARAFRVFRAIARRFISPNMGEGDAGKIPGELKWKKRLTPFSRFIKRFAG